jgi:hypothetical protein
MIDATPEREPDPDATKVMGEPDPMLRAGTEAEPVAVSDEVGLAGSNEVAAPGAVSEGTAGGPAAPGYLPPPPPGPGHAGYPAPGYVPIGYVPAGYVPAPPPRGPSRISRMPAWSRYLAVAIVGLFIGGLLGAGITSVADHHSRFGPRVGFSRQVGPRPGNVPGPYRGPGYGGGFGRGFGGGPFGNRPTPAPTTPQPSATTTG